MDEVCTLVLFIANSLSVHDTCSTAAEHFLRSITNCNTALFIAATLCYSTVLLKFSSVICAYVIV